MLPPYDSNHRNLASIAVINLKMEPVLCNHAPQREGYLALLVLIREADSWGSVSHRFDSVSSLFSYGIRHHEAAIKELE